MAGSESCIPVAIVSECTRHVLKTDVATEASTLALAILDWCYAVDDGSNLGSVEQFVLRAPSAELRARADEVLGMLRMRIAEREDRASLLRAAGMEGDSPAVLLRANRAG